MTQQEMIDFLTKELEDFCSIIKYERVIHVLIFDIIGWNENWDEIFCEYYDEEKIELIQEFLKKECLEYKHGKFYFNDYFITFSYSSSHL